jgi:flagellar hook assembly protein FlgD
VIIEKQGWLAQRYSGTTSAAAVTTYLDVYAHDELTDIDFIGANKLKAGDCAGYDHDNDPYTVTYPDNQISTADRDAIYAAFGAMTAAKKTELGITPATEDATWNAFADFDGNEVIEVEDLNYTITNTGNGEGMLHKGDYNGNNNNAVVEMQLVNISGDEYTYRVSASGMAHLHAYSVAMNIDSNDWMVKKSTDRVQDQSNTFNFHKRVRANDYFVAAVYGENIATDSNAALVEFTLTAMVENPVEPSIQTVTLVDGNNNAVSPILRGENSSAIADEFQLNQNYPNPFNPVTNINYSMPAGGFVTLKIYDMLGKEVNTLVSASLNAGSYRSVWNATDYNGNKVATGLYFYSLTVDNQLVSTKKMVLLK